MDGDPFSKSAPGTSAWWFTLWKKGAVVQSLVTSADTLLWGQADED